MDIEVLYDAIERDDRLSNLQHYVYVYCWENDILLDTAEWDELVEKLYNKVIDCYDIQLFDLNEFDEQLSRVFY